MNIIKEVIADYEKLIKTNIQIPLSNGEIISFTFKPQDLPHLLGLQYLVDNPILFEYSEKRLSATDLYKSMADGEVDTKEFENSVYFKDIYDKRIRYFNSETILEIIQARQIVKFDYAKIKNFPSKLDKIDYIFWKRYKDKDNNYGYFGIGFITNQKTKDINYPNTFFFRVDDEYICNQDTVLPYSIMKKDKYGTKEFEIYWEQLWQGLKNNKHYKELKKRYELDDGRLDEEIITESLDSDSMRHYELLQLDVLDEIYLPYMKSNFRWTNDEKRFLLNKMKEKQKDLFPNEVLQLLSEYKGITGKHKN